MEVTRQLRLERVSKKKGTAPIQLTFCWEGRRLRMAPGESARPADWNAKLGRLKDKPLANLTNEVLDRWERAANEAHQHARHAGEQWDEARMEAEIRVRYLRLLAEARGDESAGVPLPAVAEKPKTLLEHMDDWCDYKDNVVSLTSGRRLSKTYRKRLRTLRADLEAFGKLYKYPLTFAAMNQRFYDQLQHHHLTVLGSALNTFGGVVKQLKNFLSWAEQRELTTSAKFRHWTAPEVFTGADYLTAAELRRWAELDLDTPDVAAYVAEHFPPVQQQRARGRPPLQPEDHLQRLGYARDKFLQCAYLGLRISDADRMGPQHIDGELVKIDAHKTGVTCLIPFLDDDVFKPVALVAKYAGWALPTSLPYAQELDLYLPHLAHLAGIERVRVTTRIGRKTFVTLKIFQGVPRSNVMLATGHQTETNFIRYLGTDEQELIENYRRTARLHP